MRIHVKTARMRTCSYNYLFASWAEAGAYRLCERQRGAVEVGRVDRAAEARMFARRQGGRVGIHGPLRRPLRSIAVHTQIQQTNSKALHLTYPRTGWAGGCSRPETIWRENGEATDEAVRREVPLRPTSYRRRVPLRNYFLYLPHSSPILNLPPAGCWKWVGVKVLAVWDA